MRDHNFLGEFELMLLLTLIRLGDEAYGVPLSRELALMRGRDVSVGSVYASLDRLELKGLVESSLGEATPERGGELSVTFASRNKDFVQSTKLARFSAGYGSPYLL